MKPKWLTRKKGKEHYKQRKQKKKSFSQSNLLRGEIFLSLLEVSSSRRLNIPSSVSLGTKVDLFSPGSVKFINRHLT